MTNADRYKATFLEAFQYDGNVEELKYQAIEEWDSVGHMQLMAALEDDFEIEMDVDDIIDFSSFEKGKEIMSKYGVEF